MEPKGTSSTNVLWWLSARDRRYNADYQQRDRDGQCCNSSCQLYYKMAGDYSVHKNSQHTKQCKGMAGTSIQEPSLLSSSKQTMKYVIHWHSVYDKIQMSALTWKNEQRGSQQ